jgi:hypothetical protein
MKMATLRTVGTQRGLSDEPDSNVGELPLTTRTFSKSEKILETSLPTKRRLRADIRQAQDDRTVQDLPRIDLSTDEQPPVDDRARLILALLLRPEAMPFVEGVLSTDSPMLQRERLGEMLLSSQDALYCFSRLVVEGAVMVVDGRLDVTDLTNRILDLMGPAPRQ